MIEPVKEASAWVSPIVPVRKSNGTSRLCVDYRQLNKSIVRERHVLPTVEEITAQLAGAELFSVLDAESGFHQLLLGRESRPLTTFATHCGLYRFKRLPFGVSCAPEIFQRVMSDILSGLPGIVVYIDDILVFGSNRQEHDERLACVLDRLKTANLKLNWDKCRIGQEQVKYLGHILTKDGIQPDTDKLKAIRDMAAPQNVADVQRFLGMVTYLGKFVPQLTCSTAPLRALTKRVPFTVDSELLGAFNSAKEAVASSLQNLAYFRPSPDIPTAVSCDASPQGLGAMLWQKNQADQWVPIACVSRTLTEVESRYSQLEREMLGVVFGLTRFRQYVLGRHVEVYTDHKPLLPIVQKSFDDVPPRLQRWLVSLMPYDYSLKHLPGKQLSCTDTLSRAPLMDSIVSAAESRSLHEYVSLVLEACPVRITEIQQATTDDGILSKIMQRILTSTWHDISPLEQPYYVVRDQLTVVDGVILLSARIVVPEALRHAVMALAHEGHPGQEAFQDMLRQRVWWPGLTRDANLYVERCSECWRRRSNGPQELIPTEIESVWERLAIDLVSIEGHSVLSIIDYGSRFPILRPLSTTTTAAVINELDEVFALFGLPSSLVSDNGPQFVSEHMSAFLGRLGIQHIRSSPRYPQSNGMVERLHRLVRERLGKLKSQVPFRRRLNQVLFDIRHSRHRMLDMSPNDALFSRPLRSRVPAFIPNRIVNPSHQLKAKATMANDHDVRRGVGPLPHLQPGTKVIIRDGYCDPTRPWTVVEQYGRQVGVHDGHRVLLRNRRHVREFHSPSSLEFEKSETSDRFQHQLHVPSRTAEGVLSAPACKTPVGPSTVALSPGQLTETPSSTSPAPACTPIGSMPAPSQLVSLSEPQVASPPSNTHDVSSPNTSSKLFHDGMVTRAGRQVKLSEKVKASLR